MFSSNDSSNTPHSDSGLSISSSSSSEIMGTPFDLGPQRFEYPFPKTQGSPTDPFLPLSSSITPQLPPWPIHISKSFPLTQPPLGKFKAHPKLRSANVREPPVPPGLVKRRSRITGVHHQSSSEDPSDKSDVCDDVARARKRSPFPLTLSEASLRHTANSDDPTLSPSEIKQSVSFPIRSLHRPTVEDRVSPTTVATSSERTPRSSVLQRERKLNDDVYSLTVYCWIIAGQLCCWVFRFIGWVSRA